MSLESEYFTLKAKLEHFEDKMNSATTQVEMEFYSDMHDEVFDFAFMMYGEILYEGASLNLNRNSFGPPVYVTREEIQESMDKYMADLRLRDILYDRKYKDKLQVEGEMLSLAIF